MMDRDEIWPPDLTEDSEVIQHLDEASQPNPTQPPARLVHPGQILRRELAERGLSQYELAQRIGRNAGVITALVRGTHRLTVALALDLESALGISANFWVSLQTTYDLLEARAHRAQPATLTPPVAAFHPQYLKLLAFLFGLPKTDDPWTAQDWEDVARGAYVTGALAALEHATDEQLALLAEKEREIIRARWALSGQAPLTLEDLGRRYQVTRERIRQVEANAFRKLRHPEKARPLLIFLPLLGEMQHARKALAQAVEVHALRKEKQANTLVIPAPLAGVLAPNLVRDYSPLERLGLLDTNPKTLYALQRAGLGTLSSVALLTEEEALAVRGVGRVGLDSLKAALAQYEQNQYGILKDVDREEEAVADDETPKPCISCGDVYPPAGLDEDGCCGRCSQWSWLPSHKDQLLQEIRDGKREGFDPRGVLALAAAYQESQRHREALHQQTLKLSREWNDRLEQLVRQRDFATAMAKRQIDPTLGFPQWWRGDEDNWEGMP